MMTDQQLTQHLKRKQPQPAPAAWREEILDAAMEASENERPRTESRRSRFRHLGWAALAALWMMLVFSHYQGEREDQRLASYLAPSAFPAPLPLTGEQWEALLALLFTSKDQEERAPYREPTETHPQAYGPI